MAGTLVCGIDASEESHGAARAAAWLARALDGKLVLVHVVGEQAYGRSLERAEVMLRRASPDGPGEIDRCIARGTPADGLASVASATRATLVAVGSRGRGAMRSALLGSTSGAAVRRCSCPVLVFPRAAVGAPPGGRSLVCAVDGSDESEHALRAAVALADRLGLELVLVHVDAPPEPTALRSRGIHPPVDHLGELSRKRRAAIDLVDRVKHVAGAPEAARERIERGPVAERVGDVAAEAEAALIVVGARGLGPAGVVAIGSVSTRLAATAPRPVLVVKRSAAVHLHSAVGSGLVGA